MTETRLAAKLKRLIAAEGPIGIDAYMAACLGDPEHGYYATRDPLGAAGDFVTAPEVSQMFGELLGAWLAHAWAMLGRPRAPRLVELGPGRGTLTADMLRVLLRQPDLEAGLSVHLVETSPALRRRQFGKRILGPRPGPIKGGLPRGATRLPGRAPRRPAEHLRPPAPASAPGRAPLGSVRPAAAPPPWSVGLQPRCQHTSTRAAPLR